MSADTRESRGSAADPQPNLDELVEQLRSALSGDAISRDTLSSSYPDRKWVAGVTRSVQFPDGKWRDVDILVPPGAPFIAPSVSLRDKDLFLKWPHVEKDGVVCSPSAAGPCSAETFVAAGARVLEEALSNAADALSGANHEDFLDEMDAYWMHAAGDTRWKVISNLTPGLKNREVATTVVGGNTYVADDAQKLEEFVARLAPRSERSLTIDTGFLINLPSPLPPSEFPATGQALRSIVEGAQLADARALIASESDCRQSPVYVLQARLKHGWFLGAARSQWRGTVRSRQVGYGSSRATMPGFREGQSRKGVARSTLFSSGSTVLAAPIVRFDDTVTLSRSPQCQSDTVKKHVALMGCGSVGSLIFDLLVKSGVGKFSLVDPEILITSNLSRHTLGARSVGKKKAEAIAHEANADRPWMTNCSPYRKQVEDLTESDWGKILTADVIVTAIGHSGSENYLAHSARARGFQGPIVYCWLEPFAVAGHALVAYPGDLHLIDIAGTDGTESPQAVDWPDEIELTRASGGCGGEFQPYGAVDLSLHVSIMARTIMEVLEEPAMPSFHVLSTTSESNLRLASGKWSDWWIAATGNNPADRVLRTSCSKLITNSRCGAE